MELLKITEDWGIISLKLRRRYPHLASSDLLFESGKENDLINNVAERLRKSREEVAQILEKIQSEIVCNEQYSFLSEF